MRIMLVGGGSGGHISPLTAVAYSIKKQSPNNTFIIAVTQKGERLAYVLQESRDIDEVRFVRAGKFRRYHGEHALRMLFDVKRILLNIRDVFRTLSGVGQSFWLLLREKPDVIFIKGGFVGVPLGMVAGWLRIPYLTHDSDVIPGLANRIIAKRATLHAVGQDPRLYPYEQSRTVQVGVPVAESFSYVDAGAQAHFKSSLGLRASQLVVLVVGGSLGAQRLDTAFAAQAVELLKRHEKLEIFHVIGKLNEAFKGSLYADMPNELQKRVHVVTFVSDLYRYSGAADVIVTRAGATNMAEFGMQGKACVVVPNPYLTGGHQVKNAYAYETNQSAVVVAETALENLDQEVSRLLGDSKLRANLGKKLAAHTKPHAADELARLILAQAGRA